MRYGAPLAMYLAYTAAAALRASWECLSCEPDSASCTVLASEPREYSEKNDPRREPVRDIEALSVSPTDSLPSE